MSTAYHYRPELRNSFGWEFLLSESGDSVRQVGAIILVPSGQMFFGVNRIEGLTERTGPVADYIWKQNRKLGRILATHAEADAIRNAILGGVQDFSETTLIVSLAPCERCRELIEAANIKEVYYYEEYQQSTV